jgi:hypothetical protein
LSIFDLPIAKLQARLFPAPLGGETTYPTVFPARPEVKGQTFNLGNRGKDNHAAHLDVGNNCVFLNGAIVWATGGSNAGAEYGQGWNLEVSPE